MRDKANWTVLVYMGGDNNLSEEMVWSLKEMKRVRSVNDVNVVAQFDPGGLGVPTRRYVMKNGAEGDGSLAPLRGKHLGETNTGAPGALEAFISWGTKEYPAQHHMVVLSGHGSGADEDFLLKDQNPPDSLSIAELQGIFRGGRKIDIVGFDSCLMSMLEVCFALDGNVDYVVGAEGLEPQTGWPYREILSRLADHPDVQPKELASLIVAEHAAFYGDYAATAGVSVDLSACSLGKVKQVKNELNLLADALEKGLEVPLVKDAIVLAHWEAQTYKYDQYTDVRDFCALLQTRCEQIEPPTKGKEKGPARRLADACTNVDRAIDAAVVSTGHRGPAFQFSKGLSIYFPWAEVSPRYKALCAELGLEERGWPSFLERYVNSTQYLVRRAPGAGSPRRTARLREPKIKVTLSPEWVQAGDTLALTTKYSYTRYSYSRYSYSRYSYTRDSTSRKFMVKNPPTHAHGEDAKSEVRDRKSAAKRGTAAVWREKRRGMPAGV